MNSTAHLNTDIIEFFDNKASFGGAIYFVYVTMIVNINISVKFIVNAAQVHGGAIYTIAGVCPSIIVGNYSKLLFFNNSTFQGGALYSIMPSLFVTTVGYQSSIQFINNTALDVGGAVLFSVFTTLYIHDHRLLNYNIFYRKLCTIRC